MSIVIEKRIADFKVEIAKELISYIEDSGQEQKWCAKRLKLHPSLLSKIVQSKLEEFTVDRLLKYLATVRPDIVPVLKKKKAKRKIR